MYGRGQQQLGFGPPVTPPVIKGLLIANGVIFILDRLMPELSVYGSIYPKAVWQGGYLWQPFTYMWLHAGFGHVAMNMFALWMFGSQLAMAWGRKRFLRFYLICGIGAGFLIASYPYLIVEMGLQSPQSLMIPTLGASGAVYGVLLAYSLTWPDKTIMLIFPPVAFRAIWLIPGLFFMSMLMDGQNISHIGHLGGVLVGWIYLRRKGHTGTKVLSADQLRNRWRRYRMRQKLRAVHYEERRSREEERRDDDRRLH